MDAEEREGGVGYGVDEIFNEIGFLVGDFVVFAAEGNDADVEIGIGLAGKPVRVQAGAGAELLRLVAALVGLEGDAVGGFDHVTRLFAEVDLPAHFLDLLGEGVAHAEVVDDASFWNVKRGDSGGMRLEVLDLLASDSSHVSQPVGVSPIVELFHAGNFIGLGGDDEFSANFVGNALRLAKVDELAVAIAAVEGLVGAWLIVDARVDDA